MRAANFSVKAVSTAVIIVSLFYYQHISEARAEELAENEAAAAEVEAYNKKILDDEAALQAEIERLERGASGEADEPEETEVLTCYIDGTYEGTGTGFGGIITVSVTLENDVITGAAALSHDLEDPAYFDSAAAVLDEVVKKQSLDVDTVSGATFSSNGLLDAVDDALQKAVRS